MLEGRLSEFRLPDVFQLLALTRKTGVLRVTSETEGRVHFDEGAVAFAVADTRRLGLGARLVQRCSLTDEQLSGVVDAQRSGDLAALLRDLRDAGAIEDEEFRAILHEQISDAVFSLMRLDDGGFFFETRPHVDAPVLSIAGDALVAEGGRRLAEWERLRERLGPSDAVLALTPSIDAQQVTLDAEQWRVLALIDASRTVDQLADLTGEGEFATYRVVSRLIEQGLVEVCPTGARAGLAAVLERRAALERLERGQAHSAPVADPAPEDAAPAPVADPAPEDAAPAPRPVPPPTSLHAVRPHAEPPAAPSDPARERLAALRRRVQLPADEQAAPRPAPNPATVANGANGHVRPPQPSNGHDVAAGLAEVLADLEAPDPAPVETPGGPDQAPSAAETEQVAADVATEEATEEVAQEAAEVGTQDGADDVPAAAEGHQPDDVVEAQPSAPTPLAAVPYHATHAGSGVDRASVARELASLGLDDEPEASTRGSTATENAAAPRRLTRDEAVSKGLLLRLIDGVKGV